MAGGFRGGSFEYAYARVNRAVRHNLFSSLVQQEVAFFDRHKTGNSRNIRKYIRINIRK